MPPANAILNYLYAVLESESRLALAAVCLDPDLGFLHVDSRTRDSAACDLQEPIRPEVDAYVLDWIVRRHCAGVVFRDAGRYLPTDGIVLRSIFSNCADVGSCHRALGRIDCTYTLGEGSKAGQSSWIRYALDRGSSARRARRWIRSPYRIPAKPSKSLQSLRSADGTWEYLLKNCAAANSREELIKAARLGRVVAQTPSVQARRPRHNAYMRKPNVRGVRLQNQLGSTKRLILRRFTLP